MNKGFTLLEVIIVVAIVGIFISVILVTLSAGSEREERPCSEFSNYRMESLPVRCIPYYR